MVGPQHLQTLKLLACLLVPDMWRQMIDQPWTADGNITPELVSFYIASNMPVQDSTKQELLQTDNLVYRLRREIQLLESLERLCCKSCKVSCLMWLLFTHFVDIHVVTTVEWFLRL